MREGGEGSFLDILQVPRQALGPFDRLWALSFSKRHLSLKAQQIVQMGTDTWRNGLYLRISGARRLPVHYMFTCGRGAVGEGCPDVFQRELRERSQQFSLAHAFGQVVEDQRDPNPRAADAWLSTAYVGIDGNAGEKVFCRHGVHTKGSTPNAKGRIWRIRGVIHPLPVMEGIAPSLPRFVIWNEEWPQRGTRGAKGDEGRRGRRSANGSGRLMAARSPIARRSRRGFRVETRRSAKSVRFDTCDHGFDDAVLHRNLVAN